MGADVPYGAPGALGGGCRGAAEIGVSIGSKRRGARLRRVRRAAAVLDRAAHRNPAIDCGASRRVDGVNELGRGYVGSGRSACCFEGQR